MHALLNSGLYHRLHHGLRRALLKHKSRKVYFLGHSLGAAMAAIAAPMMKATLHIDDVRLWTFGCPRVGNEVCCASSLPHTFLCHGYNALSMHVARVSLFCKGM
jgi:predicted lipase